MCVYFSPSELELAVLSEEDLLVLPASRVATAGHDGDEAGRSQRQTRQHVQLHVSQVAPPQLTQSRHPRHRHDPPGSGLKATAERCGRPSHGGWKVPQAESSRTRPPNKENA